MKLWEPTSSKFTGQASRLEIQVRIGAGVLDLNSSEKQAVCLSDGVSMLSP